MQMKLLGIIRVKKNNFIKREVICIFDKGRYEGQVFVRGKRVIFVKWDWLFQNAKEEKSRMKTECL